MFTHCHNYLYASLISYFWRLVLGLREGFKKKGVGPPHSGKKIKKTKNDLRAMKRIPYDMGLLALVKWLLQRAIKFELTFGPRSQLKRVPPPKN